MFDAHLLLNLAALRAEASNCGALLVLKLVASISVVLVETLRALLLQSVGQVMEDARTVLQRLKERSELTDKYTERTHCHSFVCDDS